MSETIAQRGAPPPGTPPQAQAGVRRPRRTRPTADLTAPGRGPTRIAVWIALLAIAIAFFLPFLWLLVASIQPGAALSARINWTFSFRNFADVLNAETVYRPMLNSLIISGGTALITVLAATFAAYPLSRYHSRFGRILMYGILFATGLPITAIMVPVYGLFVQVDLIDTYTGTILFMATTAMPISIWLSKNFMDAVPIDLEEAAWTDGASPMQALRRIVLPLMWPGIAVVALYTFIGLWGNFFVPFVLLLSNDNLPASVSIYTFFSQYAQVVYGQLAAYSMLYSLPAVLLYLMLSRRLSGAFTFGGAVKG
jgi:multiple sugar transport system permease protein